MQAFLVPEDVGPHVPDELVCEELRLLGGVEQELGDVAHRVIADRLHQLRHVEQQALLQTACDVIRAGLLC